MRAYCETTFSSRTRSRIIVFPWCLNDRVRSNASSEEVGCPVNPFVVILLILLIISGLGLIVFILLHSGKGTGVSDMIASSLYSSQTGMGIIEKNLDRITIVFAIVFFVCLFALMLLYPQGTIAAK